MIEIEGVVADNGRYLLRIKNATNERYFPLGNGNNVYVTYVNTLFLIHYGNVVVQRFKRSEVSIPSSTDDGDLLNSLYNIIALNGGGGGGGGGDVNILNQPIDTDTNITNASLDVNILNQPVSTTFTNTAIDVNVLNQPISATFTNSAVDSFETNPLMTDEDYSYYNNDNVQNTIHLVYNGKCLVRYLVIHNTNSAPRDLKIFDSSSTPVLGTTIPKISVSAGSNETKVVKLPITINDRLYISATTSHLSNATAYNGTGLYVAIIYKI